MRGLKFLVIFLGVVILGGMAVLGVTIAKRASSKLTVDSSPPASASFGTVTHAIPEGAYVKKSRVEGERLFLHLALEDGAVRILILSLKDGSLLGTIALDPQP